MMTVGERNGDALARIVGHDQEVCSIALGQPTGSEPPPGVDAGRRQRIDRSPAEADECLDLVDDASV